MENDTSTGDPRFIDAALLPPVLPPCSSVSWFGGSRAPPCPRTSVNSRPRFPPFAGGRRATFPPDIRKLRRPHTPPFAGLTALPCPLPLPPLLLELWRAGRRTFTYRPSPLPAAFRLPGPPVPSGLAFLVAPALPLPLDWIGRLLSPRPVP